MHVLRTLAWLACIVYSTIPLFWLMIHPRAHRWRARQASPFLVLVPMRLLIWVGMAALTSPWRNATFYSTPWTWFPDCSHLPQALSSIQPQERPSVGHNPGLPEVRAGHRDDRLITTGIRSRVRHPVYLSHLCDMLAWSLGTGLAVCWLLTALSIATGA